MKKIQKIFIIISIILLLISSYPLFNLLIELINNKISSVILLFILRMLGLICLFIPIFNIMKKNKSKKIYKVLFWIITTIEIISVLLMAITINSKYEFIPILIILFGTLSTPINMIFLIYQALYLTLKIKLPSKK